MRESDAYLKNLLNLTSLDRLALETIENIYLIMFRKCQHNKPKPPSFRKLIKQFKMDFNIVDQLSIYNYKQRTKTKD